MKFWNAYVFKWYNLGCMHAMTFYQNNTGFAKYDFLCKLRQPAPVSHRLCPSPVNDATSRPTHKHLKLPRKLKPTRRSPKQPSCPLWLSAVHKMPPSIVIINLVISLVYYKFAFRWWLRLAARYRCHCVFSQHRHILSGGGSRLHSLNSTLDYRRKNCQRDHYNSLFLLVASDRVRRVDCNLMVT